MVVKTLDDVSAQQRKNGLFPTYRAKKEEKIQESTQIAVENIGIHTFILEGLLRLAPIDKRIIRTFKKGLDFLLRNSIPHEGKFLWRWLKDPQNSDQLYPPDYDDTARARTLIEIAKMRGLELPEEFKEFNYPEFISQGLTPYGALTFVGNKPGNVVDPVVNANLLYSYSLYLKNRDINQEKDKLYNKIRKYLEGVIDSIEFNSPGFSRCSRIYLSENLFVYLISMQKESFPEGTLKKVRGKVEEEQRGYYKNPLEASWATLSLINLGGNEGLIKRGLKKIKDSQRSDSLWDAYPFYQHQRLGLIFGSRAGTSIFCLEALNKYKLEGGK